MNNMTRPTSAPAAVAAAPLELTPDEERMVLQYRATTDRWQRMSLSMAEFYAKEFPRSTRSALRLVSGGSA